MKIKLTWHEAIELGTSSSLRENINNFDFSNIPEISGVYVFYREYGNSQKALYVGQSRNIRKRIKDHFNSRKLVEGLENTPQGMKKLIFAEISTRGDLKLAMNQAEKALIQHYIENDHPLLNQKLMSDKFDEVVSDGEHIIDLVNIDIWVYA